MFDYRRVGEATLSILIAEPGVMMVQPYRTQEFGVLARVTFSPRVFAMHAFFFSNMHMHFLQTTD